MCGAGGQWLTVGHSPHGTEADGGRRPQRGAGVEGLRHTSQHHRRVAAALLPTLGVAGLCYGHGAVGAEQLARAGPHALLDGDLERDLQPRVGQVRLHGRVGEQHVKHAHAAPPRCKVQRRLARSVGGVDMRASVEQRGDELLRVAVGCHMKWSAVAAAVAVGQVKAH